MEFPEEGGHLNDEELRIGLLGWNSRQGSIMGQSIMGNNLRMQEKCLAQAWTISENQ